MIKILLADDEDYIRQGIRYTIPWNAHDMEIVVEASNGMEALELAIKLRPDIILADIQMPLLNGLELTDKLGTLLPDTRIIILTAYGNTENLTHAIDVKVSAFLLKNADSEKILKTVTKVKLELEQQLERQKKTENLRGIFDDNRHLIKATLMTRFLLNQVSYTHFIDKAHPLAISTDAGSYTMLLIKCSCSDEKLAVGQFIQYFHKYQPFVFFVTDQLAVVILETTLQSLTDEKLDELLPSLLPLTFGNSIAVMRDIESYEEFPMCFSLLSHILDHCFWNTEMPYTVISPQDTIAINNGSVPTGHLVESRLLTAVLSRSAGKIKQNLNEYYEHMKQNHVSRQLFLDSVERVLLLIHAASEAAFNLEQAFSTLADLETPEEIIELIKSLALPDAPPASHSQITAGLEYISLHYNEDIHLEDVARVSYLSAGYLSRIFKSETGYSFKEYLHMIRIKKAQELLCSTGLKYYEIAEKVGYRNYKYFSSYFSKVSGCSAKEYQIRNMEKR